MKTFHNRLLCLSYDMNELEIKLKELKKEVKHL